MSTATHTATYKNKKEIKEELKALRQKRVLYVNEMQVAMSLMGKIMVRKMIDKLDRKARQLDEVLRSMK